MPAALKKGLCPFACIRCCANTLDCMLTVSPLLHAAALCRIMAEYAETLAGVEGADAAQATTGSEAVNKCESHTGGDSRGWARLPHGPSDPTCYARVAGVRMGLLPVWPC